MSKAHTRWTEEEIALLRSMYPTQRAQEIADTIGRSVGTVLQMAQRIGVRKSPEATTAIRRSAAHSEASVAARFKPKHGRASIKAGTYRTWLCMKQRCGYEGHKSYARYGGRGIKVCARWVDSFENFLADMGETPDGHTLGRIDNDGNYEPGNCRWETQKEQARNRRSSRWLTAWGETKCAAAWCEQFGIASDTLNCRLKSGTPLEEALSKPVASPRAKGFAQERLADA